MRRLWLVVPAFILALVIPAQAATASRPRQSTGSGAAYGGTLATFWGSTAYSEYCGLAFPWRTPSGYYRFVTAGHCLQQGRRVNYTVAGSRYMGGYISKSATVRFGGGHDSALLVPTYKPHAYIYRYGTKSTTVSAIKGTQTNYRGLRNICISGAYRGESCGWTITAKEDIADSTGHYLGNEWKVTKPRNGTCPIGDGDSGSPFYINISGGVRILGLLSGMRNTSSYCGLYMVGWEKIKATYGGSVMTA